MGKQTDDNAADVAADSTAHAATVASRYDVTERGLSMDSVWGPAYDAVTSALSATPTTIAQVRDQLDELQSALEQVPPLHAQNSIASFNLLYHEITSEVADYPFEDPAFLELLDVEFAKRYFCALRLFATLDPKTPKCWRILFSRLRAAHVSPVQAALAGVNAHVNFDLTFALISTFEQLGLDRIPGADSPRHRDYVAVNGIFVKQVVSLCVQLESSPRRAMATTGHPTVIDELENEVGLQLLRYSRHRAWDRASTFWGLRTVAGKLDTAETKLDEMIGELNEFLLSSFAEIGIDPHWDAVATPTSRP
jgi:hypothetical protein